MTEPERYDYVVLGGGSGGVASARRAAAHGARVALVERDRLGGTCVNVGCVPKKVTWYAAELAGGFADAADYGFAVERPPFDLGALRRARDAYVARLNASYGQTLASSGVTVLKATARFTGERTIVAGDRALVGEHVLVATGSRPRLPQLAGARHGIDSDGFFALDTLPGRVALVGGGYIATELAGIFHALGSAVTLILRGERLLGGFDCTARDLVMEAMLESGVALVPRREVIEVRRRATAELDLALDDGTWLEGFDCLVWAIGREPVSDGIGLEEAGVRKDAQGFVEVDEWQQTTAARVYAVGDVTGRLALTPVAIAAGRRLADRVFGGKPDARLDYEDVPTVVFSHPPLATVGLSEEAAKERFGDAVRCYVSRGTGLYHGITRAKGRYVVKLVTVGPDERVVGVHAVGRGADELIQGFAVAVRLGAKKADLDATVAVHPTLSEELVLLR
ncbi:MAG: glutathione-disulfide reductase [Polyangiaceae bacterium]|nr:glutathione-disulfide reductase [Polyangiaceae bacterium]